MITRGWAGAVAFGGTAPPILVFPDWDAVADGSRPFHVYCDACIDGFGAALELEQPDGSVRPIAYVSRATLDSGRHWTPMDLEAGSIIGAIKRLRGYLWGTKFRIYGADLQLGFGPQKPSVHSIASISRATPGGLGAAAVGGAGAADAGA